MTGFDIGSLQAKEKAGKGAPLTLCHPISGEKLQDKDGKPVTITLLGSDSDEYQKQDRANNKARLAKAQRSRRFIPTPEELEADNVALLAAVTTGWSGIVVNGEAPECNTTQAAKLYKEQLWVREQVNEFVSDRSNFLVS